VNVAAVRTWCSRLALGLLVVLALLFVALRIVVARVPAYSAEIRAWVERETRLALDFDSLDARLRWYGPEVVLRDAKLYEPVDRQPLFTTREARIALDLWSLFRTGELVAGTVRLVGPEVVVVRLPDGRIRLLNQLERPADRPPFDLDALPAGRVDIVDATVEFRDLLAKRAPLELTDLDLHLVRQQDSVQASGIARLPPELGGEIEIEGSLAGALMQPATLRGRIDAQIDDARLPGWGKLLPAGLARIEEGSGEFQARLDFASGRIDEVRVDLDTEDIALTLPARKLPGIETVVLTKEASDGNTSALRLPGLEPSFVTRPAAATPHSAAFDRLAAKLRLRRDGAGWSFRVAELEAAPAGSRRGHALRALGDVSGRFAGNLRTTYAFGLDARDLRVGELWPLALAFAPPEADRWLGLGPSGEIHALSLDARRPRAGAIPQFRVSADVQDLSVQPSGRLPGVQRLTAVLSGTDERGRISLRSEHAGLQWPRMFVTPLLAEELHGDFDWTREGREWRLAGHDLTIERPGLKAHGNAELHYVSPAVSPYLVLDLDVDSADARLVPEFLPVGRLKARTLAWLERAFVAGDASGHLAYRGPTRKFPFPHGEGDFSATAEVRGATLDYFPGFAPLTDAAGVVRFHNAGLDGDLAAGKVADLALRSGKVAIPDLKNAVIGIEAGAEGDVGAALGFLQGSPLAPRLGPLFNQLSGSGPADYLVALSLPLRDPASRDYRVRTEFRSATVRLPALRAPIVDLTGTFELHNLEARASDLRGLFLDGPFTASVTPDVGMARAPDGAVAVNVQAVGRASGSRLPGFIGLPEGIGMRGAASWDLVLRSERPSATAGWTTHVNVATNLVGVTIDAPKPFAKAADQARDTRVRLDFNPDDRNDVAIESGGARAQLSFLERDGRWQLDRGLARFDGGPMPRTPRTGLQVVGDWPEFDLGEWLALGSSTSGRGQLADWLGRVDVRLEEARVFGYQLRDVQAQLDEDGTNWLVDLECPMVEGRVTVPLDTRSDAPILLDLRKLVLQSTPAANATDTTRTPVDPRRLQPLRATIDDFTWEGRHFGKLAAEVRKEADGLDLTSVRTETPDFSFVGHGSWLVGDAGERSTLELEFDSTNLAAAAQSLGYRQSIEAEKAHAKADLHWAGPPSGDDLLSRLEGTVRIDLGRGRLRNVEPGAAGRVLGLMSVVELPRRLALDFRDVTEEGLAFDSVSGDFRLTGGNAYTENLLLKGAAVDIGIAGRTGLASEDYDQTVVVSGNPSGPLTVAGALAAGPVVGAGVLVLSQLFKGQLQGLTKVYYRITGPWSEPVVQRVSAAGSEGLAAQGAAHGAARESPK
jgi:uncharacterized protein (TIGR02099 family)